MKSSLCALSLLSCFLFSCAGSEINSDTPEGMFSIAEELDKGERYEEAIRRYMEVRNKFPYSQYAIKAKLAIADAHFKGEAYPEAQLAYQSFKDLHPSHPQIAYVTFRIGLSYYNQLPSTIDRDLSVTRDAIAIFDELISSFPKSEYVKEAREKRADSIRKLAEKEDYIGHFYFVRKKYGSALRRYEDLLKSFPHYEEPKILSRLAISAHKVNLAEKARVYLKRLKEKYPDSSEYKEARKVVQ